MKNSADLGGCCPPRPSASVGNTLLDLQNSWYPARPNSIIAKYIDLAKPKSGAPDYKKNIKHEEKEDFKMINCGRVIVLRVVSLFFPVTF